MARTIPTSPLTPADELRLLLDISEKRAVNIRGIGAETASELLHRLDRIHELLPELEANGIDLRAERVRWQSLQGSVRRHAQELQAELAPLGGLAACRAALPETPPAEQWWWWLDEHDRQRRSRTWRKIGLFIVVGALLLLGARKVLPILFPVDPQVIQAMELRNEGDRWLEQGDLDRAIASYEAAHAALPDDNDIQVWLAGMYWVQGDKDRSRAIVDQLVPTLGASQTHAGVAQVLVQLQDTENAIIMAQQAIEEDPQNANAYLALGGAYEASDKYNAAIEQFARAATVAEANDQPELMAIARVRQAQLLQRLPLQKSQNQTTP